MKIAIVTHGRFEVFYLAIALIERGHDVRVFINYPKSITNKFGLESKYAHNNIFHGIALRLLGRWNIFEPLLYKWFGQWALHELKKEQWDSIFVMSGIAEEIMEAFLKSQSIKIVLVRASAHIRTQAKILNEEAQRVGTAISCPSDWIIAREEKEYELAQHIRVLSQFSHESFLQNSIDEKKLWLHPSAYPLKEFSVTDEVLRKRSKRILAGLPLNILFVGTLSFRKGIWDLMEIMEKLSSLSRFRFKLVGQILNEITPLLLRLGKCGEIIGRVPEQQLSDFYDEADIFIFPTLEDGYPQVLAQAFVRHLPILATPNSCAPDIIQHGKTGWIIPIRRPDLFIEQLLWCDQHRKEIVSMLESSDRNKPRLRTWGDAAAEAEFFLREK